MASEHDGSVIIDVDIDSKGFDRGTHDVENAIKSMESAMSRSVDEMSKSINRIFSADSGDETKFLKLENSVQKAENRVANLSSRLDELGSKKIPTAEYSEISAQISKCQKDMDRLVEKSVEMKAQGKAGTQSWNENEAEIAEIKRVLGDANIELNELVRNGRAFTLGSETQQYQRLSAQLRTAQNDLTIARTRAEEFNAASESNRFSNTLDGIKNKFSQLFSFGKTGTTLTNIAKGFGKVTGAIAKAASKLNVFNKGQTTAEALAKRFSKQFTRIFTMLKGRIVRTLVTSLFTGITEGIQGIAKVDTQFNKIISELRSRFAQLKFSIVGAFSPLITAAAPILNEIMIKVTSIADKVGQITAALAGQSTYTKAAYNFTDYAKSLDKSKNKTDKLADSTKKLNNQLAKFDELNVLNQNDSDSNSNEPELFTNAYINTGLSDLSRRIKDAFFAGDMRGLGEELAVKLNSEIEKISSSEIGSRIARIINAGVSFAVGFLSSFDFKNAALKVTENLNTMISDIDAAQIGELISEILGAAIDIGFTFKENFDWTNLGSKFGESINKIIENTDWEKAGETLSGIIIGLLDTALSFFDTLDDDKLQDGVNSFMSSFDAGGIALRLAKLFLNILQLAWILLKGMWKTENILSFWQDEGEKWGQTIADRFIIPIKELIRKIKYDFRHGNWKELFGEVFSAPFILMINSIIDRLNRISFDIPDFVPQWGGTRVGFDIPRIELPHLAKGTVIPANYGEFAAILGDNKRETEIVSPVSAMKQAFLEALAESGISVGGATGGDTVVQIDGREVFRAIRNQADDYSRTHGGRPAFGAGSAR